MTNTLIGLLSAGVLAVGGLAAAAGLGDPDPAGTVSLPAATTTADETTTQGTTTQETTTTVESTTTIATTTDEDDRDDDDHDDEDRSGSNSVKG